MRVPYAAISAPNTPVVLRLWAGYRGPGIHMNVTRAVFQMAYESSLDSIANVLPVATNRARSPMLTSIYLRKLERYPPYICQIALAMGQVWHYHLADMGRLM